MWYQMGELYTRVLAALDEAKAMNQTAQESEGNTRGFTGFLRNFLKHGASQGDEFERKADSTKLLSYLEQTSNLMQQIVKVSLQIIFDIVKRVTTKTSKFPSRWLKLEYTKGHKLMFVFLSQLML